MYAALWTSSGIRVWHFAPWELPENVRNGSPDPNTWGQPMANFGNGGCDFDWKFRDMSIVRTTSFDLSLMRIKLTELGLEYQFLWRLGWWLVERFDLFAEESELLGVCGVAAGVVLGCKTFSKSKYGM